MSVQFKRSYPYFKIKLAFEKGDFQTFYSWGTIMSLPFKILYRGNGRVWPADEVQSDRASDAVEENMELNMNGFELEEAIIVGQTDFGEDSPCTCEDNWENSCPGRSGEHGGKRESFQEVDLAASSTPRTIVDLKVAVYKTSTTGSNLRSEYLLSTSASDAVTGIDGSGETGTNNAKVRLDTTQSLQQMHHVTEVVTVDVEVPSVLSASVNNESIQTNAANLEDVVVRKKCTRWICPYDKSRFEVALLVLCYVIIGVIFFPFTMVILMICCISYFTPGIDD